MPLTLNGTTGVAGINGSASTPSIQGTDTNTGVWFPAADTVAIATNGTERMRVDSSGNVGIGTSSPSTYGKLAVTTPTAGYGVLSVSNSAGGGGGGQLSYYYGTAKVAYVDSAVSNGTPGSETASLAFATINSGTIAERARINSGGAFLVGTASTGSMAGGYSTQFIVVGDDRYTHNRMIIGCGSSTSSYDATIYPQDSGVIFNNNSNSRDYIFIKQSGAVYATVTAIINNVSDHRLKENIVDMNGALDKLARVRPVHYNFKGDVETKMPWGESTVDGFIAHELQEVMPEAVYGEKDAVYEDGKIKPQQVDMTRLIPALVGAVQELSAKVEGLQSEINALKGAA